MEIFHLCRYHNFEVSAVPHRAVYVLKVRAGVGWTQTYKGCIDRRKSDWQWSTTILPCKTLLSGDLVDNTGPIGEIHPTYIVPLGATQSRNCCEEESQWQSVVVEQLLWREPAMYFLSEKYKTKLLSCKRRSVCPPSFSQTKVLSCVATYFLSDKQDFLSSPV